MDEQDGIGGGSTGGTGRGGHGGHDHAPRGQPAGIGVGPLYFLVVTAGTIVALAAIWLLCYGVKRYRKMWKKRSQRRVGCFPTEETSIALNEDGTHRDVTINIETVEEEVSMEPKTSPSVRKADYTVVKIFDEEEELETVPQLIVPVEGSSRNFEVRIEMDEEEEQEQEKVCEKISIEIYQRENPEINQNDTQGNETCQIEAQAIDDTGEIENLQKSLELTQEMSFTVLKEAIQADEEYESSPDEDFEELDNSRLQSPKSESSSEEEAELHSDMTCEQMLMFLDQQPLHVPETMDNVEIIRRQQSLLCSTMTNSTEEEPENGSGSESELEEQGNRKLPDSESSNGGSSIMAAATKEGLDSGTESQDESSTNGQLNPTISITQKSVEQAQAMNYANGNTTEDEFEEPNNGQLTDYESADEALAASSSSIAQELEEDWESDLGESDGSHQVGLQTSCISRAVDDMQQITRQMKTNPQTMTMSDDDFEIARMEALFEEVESSRTAGHPSRDEEDLETDEDLVPEEVQPETVVLTVATGNCDEDKISKGTLFSALNNNTGTFDENRNEDATLVYVLTTNEDSLQMPSPQALRDTLENWDGSTPALAPAQAEGGWIRKKVDNSVARPATHHMTLGSSDDVLGIGPGILTTILEPVNRFFAQIISPDESQIPLAEPEEPVQLNIESEDFEDIDQEAIRAAVSRLTRPKGTGIVSFLNFCQAEGSPHEPEHCLQEKNNFPEVFTVQSSNAELIPQLYEEDKKPPPTYEELEQQEIEAQAKMLFPEAEQDGETSAIPDSGAEKEADAKPKDENRNEASGTETKPTCEPVNIQANLSDSPLQNVRQTFAVGGVPIDLNINLNLTGCCLHVSGNSGNVHGQPNTNAACGRGVREPSPEPMMPNATESQEFQKMSETKEEPDTCPCPRTGDPVICGEEHPENRVYGIRTMLDFMQAEGSPCCAHQEETEAGIGIGAQLSELWDSAVRALTPNFNDESESSYADTVAGAVTVKGDKKCSQEKSETLEKKINDRSASEGRNSDEATSNASKRGQGLKYASDQKPGSSKRARTDGMQ